MVPDRSGLPNSAVTPGTIKGPVRFQLPSGVDIQFGTTPAGNVIGQFFPRAGTGVELLSKVLLDAIGKIMG
jgi:hypothetical protein